MTRPDTAARPTMEQRKAELCSAGVADAHDSRGYRRQSPPGPSPAMPGVDRLIGRCRTTLWTDMAHEDPRPYELDLEAVDGCRPGDVIVCAAHGSMRSGIWGELLSTAARNSGCVGVVIDGAVRDVAKMTAMG